MLVLAIVVWLAQLWLAVRYSPRSYVYYEVPDYQTRYYVSLYVPRIVTTPVTTNLFRGSRRGAYLVWLGRTLVRSGHQA